jgi:hypothetical protein
VPPSHTTWAGCQRPSAPADLPKRQTVALDGHDAQARTIEKTPISCALPPDAATSKEAGSAKQL